MRTILLIAALLVATAPAHPQDQAKQDKTRDMSTDVTKHKQAITTLFEKCFNQGQVERLPDLIAPDYRGPNGQSGPTAFAATITGNRTTLPDLHYTLEDLVGDGDRVAVRWRLEGTQDGAFRGFPATHKHVTTFGMAIFQFNNDRITRSWLLTDQLGFLQQIGALPSEIKPSVQPEKQNSTSQ